MVDLLVAGLLTAAPPSAEARCRFIPGKAGGRVVDEAARAPVAQAKRCGGAVAGRIAGVKIDLFMTSGRSGTWGAKFGSAKTAWGIFVSTVLAASARELSDAYDVPWPNRHSRTARRHAKTKYNVYQIYYLNERTQKKDAFKYGITRVGHRRPASQITRCEEHPKTHTERCRWKWLRANVVGWYRARVIESTYCAKYIARKGRTPYGMPRCL